MKKLITASAWLALTGAGLNAQTPYPVAYTPPSSYSVAPASASRFPVYVNPPAEPMYQPNSVHAMVPMRQPVYYPMPMVRPMPYQLQAAPQRPVAPMAPIAPMQYSAAPQRPVLIPVQNVPPQGGPGDTNLDTNPPIPNQTEIDENPSIISDPAPGSEIWSEGLPTDCEPQPLPGSGWMPPRVPPGQRYYGSAAFVYWFLQKQSSPPLIAVANPIGDPPNLDPASIRLFSAGNASLQNEALGGRFSLGAWLDPQQTWGIEAGALFTTTTKSRDIINGPITFRPFISTDTGAQEGVITNSPPNLTNPFPPPNPTPLPPIAGSNFIEATQGFWGVEANLRRELSRSEWFRFDIIAGVRYFNLEESLEITSASQFGTAPINLSDAFVTTSDIFRTGNRFIGPQIGAEWEMIWNRVHFDVWGKVAVGDMMQTANVGGLTDIVNPLGLPQPTQQLQGGVLATASNIGKYRRDQIGVIPEVGLQVGYRLSNHIRCSVGYQLLYLINVVRPGDVIDPVVNPTQIPQFFLPATGASRPAFEFQNSNFWAQGINLEMEFRF